MSINPKIGHIVNFKDKDGKVHKGAQVLSKHKGFNYEGKELTYYIVSDASNTHYTVFPDDMEYFKY